MRERYSEEKVMADTAGFDLGAAHKHFSAQCFNAVWGLLDKAERSAAEDQEMIQLALASIWHWTQRDDCSDTSMSVGYWQASRVHAVAGHADQTAEYLGEARRITETVSDQESRKMVVSDLDGIESA
jgi:hypothetical protein